MTSGTSLNQRDTRRRAGRHPYFVYHHAGLVHLDDPPPKIIGDDHAAVGQRLEAGGPDHADVVLLPGDGPHDLAGRIHVDDFTRIRHGNHGVSIGKAHALIWAAFGAALTGEAPHDLARLVHLDDLASG